MRNSSRKVKGTSNETIKALEVERVAKYIRCQVRLQISICEYLMNI